jgi:hypothetical protein
MERSLSVWLVLGWRLLASTERRKQVKKRQKTILPVLVLADLIEAHMMDQT